MAVVRFHNIPGWRLRGSLFMCLHNQPRYLIRYWLYPGLSKIWCFCVYAYNMHIYTPKTRTVSADFRSIDCDIADAARICNRSTVKASFGNFSCSFVALIFLFHIYRETRMLKHNSLCFAWAQIPDMLPFFQPRYNQTMKHYEQSRAKWDLFTTMQSP